MSDITITPLGTISPYPKGNRNNPAFLIENNNEKILLDCGNGSTRLLDLPAHLENLHIFITHFHFDHFGDIGTLQYASYCHHNIGDINKKINIYLPDNDFNFYRQSIISNKEAFADYFSINNNIRYEVGDLVISFQDNNSHTIESYMVKIETKDKKIVYTSDIGTTNFEGLVEFCKDSDILICESSFLRKHHSNSTTHFTAYDAGRLANESNSKKLLLTHLWPNEERSAYKDEAKEVFKNTEVAEEGKKLVLRRNKYE